MAALLRTALSEVVDMDALAAAATPGAADKPAEAFISVLILGIIELADEPVEHLTHRQGKVVRIFRENGGNLIQEKPRLAIGLPNCRDPENKNSENEKGTSKNIPLWFDDRRSGSRRGRSFRLSAALWTSPLRQLWRECLLAQTMIDNGLYDEGYGYRFLNPRMFITPQTGPESCEECCSGGGSTRIVGPTIVSDSRSAPVETAAPAASASSIQA
jgi:hypothetical protein